MVRVVFLSVSVLALSLPGGALAQDATDDGEVLLPQFLITAGRTPVEQEKSGRAFTVITGEQLEQNQTRYVADALRQVPGFHVSRTGSFGGLTQVRVRGAEANHLLVLIDGVEVSGVNDGEFDFGGLQVTDVDRIEVLRGPQSAFWGANANSGVINIITKRGRRNGVDLKAVSEGGTDGTAMVGGTISGGTDRFDAAFSARFRRTDGFNVSVFGNEKDGDENLTATGRFTFDANEYLVFDGAGRMVDRTSDTEALAGGLVLDADRQTSTLEFSGTLGATWTSLDEAWTHIARLSGNTGQREGLADGVTSFGSEGGRAKISGQSTYKFDTAHLIEATHRITGGYEWEEEYFRARPPIFDASQLQRRKREIQSLVGEYRGEFAGQFFFNAAIRHDYNDEFDDSTTYSVAGAWAVPHTTLRLHASVGTGVTNPTFFEQFGFIPATFVGNPDLVPEESFGWDVGIEKKLHGGDLVADVTYFSQDLENEISGFGTPFNQPGVSKRRGIEFSANARLFDGFSAITTYTYTHSTDFAGRREVRRPLHSGSLSLAYTFHDSRARIFAELIYNGEMDEIRNRMLDEYVVVNIGGSYQITDLLEAYARVENLFDEDYQEVFGYNTQGLTAFFGVRGTF